MKMDDVIEDGIPPDPRVGDQPLHLNLQMTIRQTSHLPGVLLSNDPSTHGLSRTGSVHSFSASSVAKSANATITVTFDDQVLKRRSLLHSAPCSLPSMFGLFSFYTWSLFILYLVSFPSMFGLLVLLY